MIKIRKDLLANSALLLLLPLVFGFKDTGAIVASSFFLILGTWGLGCGLFGSDALLIKEKPTKEKLVKIQSKLNWFTIAAIFIIFTIALIKGLK